MGCFAVAIQSCTIFSNSSVVMPAWVAMTMLEDGVFAAGQRAFHVALEQRGERLFVLPLGMLRRQRLHAVEREEELEIHRLLGPQRAVVVEGGDAFGGRHEVRARLPGDFRDECDDGLLGLAVVPGGQRVLGMGNRRQQSQAYQDSSRNKMQCVFSYSSSLRAGCAGTEEAAPGMTPGPPALKISTYLCWFTCPLPPGPPRSSLSRHRD